MSRRDPLLGEIEALYVDDYQQFFRVARGILGDRERAAEAVQDAFVDAVRARCNFRRDRSRHGSGGSSSTPLGRQHVGPPHALAEFAPLIARLPERQRLTVLLRYYADLDYRTIADVLDVELGTVSAALAAAHAALRTSMREVETNG